jgi:hypothetical protein
VSELIELLTRLKGASNTTNDELLSQAITLAAKLDEEKQALKEEVECLSQIISDVRERDARKKCLCRGF